MAQPEACWWLLLDVVVEVKVGEGVQLHQHLVPGLPEPGVHVLEPVVLQVPSHDQFRALMQTVVPELAPLALEVVPAQPVHLVLVLVLVLVPGLQERGEVVLGRVVLPALKHEASPVLVRVPALAQPQLQQEAVQPQRVLFLHRP